MKVNDCEIAYTFPGFSKHVSAQDSNHPGARAEGKKIDFNSAEPGKIERKTEIDKVE